MKRNLQSLLIALFVTLMPYFAIAERAPASLAIVCVDQSSGDSADDARSAVLTKEISDDFSRSGRFSVISPAKVIVVRDRLASSKSFDPNTRADAVALGKALEAQAIAVCVVKVQGDNADLNLKLFETENGRRIMEKAGYGPVSGLNEWLGMEVDKIVAAWSSTGSTVEPAVASAPAVIAAPIAAASSAPASPIAASASAPADVGSSADAPISPGQSFVFSILAGYATVAGVNWEIETSIPKLPVSAGVEISYTRLSSIALPVDILSLSAVGRYWPMDALGKRKLFLSLAAGASMDFNGGFLAGPFRVAAGWCFELGERLGSVRLANALRVQPELGLTWSPSVNYYNSFSIGFTPYAGLKLGI